MMIKEMQKDRSWNDDSYDGDEGRGGIVHGLMVMDMMMMRGIIHGTTGVYGHDDGDEGGGGIVHDDDGHGHDDERNHSRND
jgi:hypothetical protein